MDVQQSYQQRGYHVFRNALPAELVNALAGLVHSHIRHRQEPLLRHDGSFSTHQYARDTELIQNSLMDCHLPVHDAMRPVETALASLIASPEAASRLRQPTVPHTTRSIKPSSSSSPRPPTCISMDGASIPRRAAMRIRCGSRCRT